jgi:hypothetical protein
MRRIHGPKNKNEERHRKVAPFGKLIRSGLIDAFKENRIAKNFFSIEHNATLSKGKC